MSESTRRGFFATLGAAGVALAALYLERRAPQKLLTSGDPPQRPYTGTVRWIGHG